MIVGRWPKTAAKRKEKKKTVKRKNK